MAYPDFKVDPDFGRLETALRRGTPDRVPFLDLFIDDLVLAAIREAPFSLDPDQQAGERAEALARLGYDGVPVSTDFRFPFQWVTATDTAALAKGEREWVNESRGDIETWEDFERYPWPEPSEESYLPIVRAAEGLCEGMKLVPTGPGGVLENVMWLMGYQPMSYAMADEPDLIQAMFDRVGETLVRVFDAMASHEAAGAVCLGDDMGFKTQTMISPADLRKYVFPWQRRIVDTVHAHGRPFILHACGNLEAVMDDLIDDVGIDAKHSFEDVFIPMEEAKRKWGHRVALIGGLDVDRLSRGTPEQVRTRTREVLQACMPGGGFVLGSGNSIPNYIPVENYLAMLEEGWSAGVYS